MGSYDFGCYRRKAQFETEVFPNVFWVPLASLGGTRYTGEEMERISALPLTEKKSRIRTLYEAVQLFYYSGFRGVMDNTDLWIDGVHWQTHKSPEEAVLSNEGCCATDTNWLAYFLEGVYEHVGSFCYANTDGNGHITSHVRHRGHHYFLDMMMCRADSQDYLCEETGCWDDLKEKEWAGFLYRCREPEDFYGFMIERLAAKGRDIPFCFYLRESPFVTATGEKIEGDSVEFLVPHKDRPNIIYTDNNPAHRLLSADGPER